MTNNSSSNRNSKSRSAVQGQMRRPAQRAPQRASQRASQRAPQRASQRAPQRNAAIPVPGSLYFKILALTAIMLLLAISVTGVGGAVMGVMSLINKDPQNNGGGQTTYSKGKTFGTALPCATAVGNYKPTGTGTEITGINGEVGILVDAESGKVIASKNADELIHPASMTKVMTLIIAAENGENPNAKLTIEQEMLDKMNDLGGSGAIMSDMTVVDKSGNMAEEKLAAVGHKLSFEDTMYLINYASDTVACLMVAKHVAGSEEAFVDMMNAKAKDLGLEDTKFVNTTGLTEEDKSHNKTTARDMAAIMAYALKNEVVKNIISSTELFRPTIYNKNGKAIQYRISTYAGWFSDANRLHGSTGGKNRAGEITIKGGKTGYEEYPDKTVSFATYGTTSAGKEYICIAVSHILNTGKDWTGSSTWENNTQDIRTIYKKYI